ncbi:MAG: transglutaminase domain-containing protein, partial [Verrucomicrobia bacterium]|nr:transglutaminase domain-containing protein [Verrucomicrobiota bacterium]
NRFEVTQGRDLVVTPSPANSPINFLVYPLLEVDGKIVKTENEFSFKRVKKKS